MRRPGRHFRPFAGSGRRTVIAIFATFALVSGATVALSIAATSRSQNRATVVEIAGRQRTLAERYVQEVLLVRAGEQANPALTASTLAATASALLNGGTAPVVQGDDDATPVGAATGSIIRNQLAEEQHLVRDLAAYGSALLAHRSLYDGAGDRRRACRHHRPARSACASSGRSRRSNGAERLALNCRAGQRRHPGTSS